LKKILITLIYMKCPSKTIKIMEVSLTLKN